MIEITPEMQAHMDEQTRLIEERLFGDKVDLAGFRANIGFPPYNEIVHKGWRLEYKPDQPHKGYFNGMCVMNVDGGNPILSEDATSAWMGVTAREVESHVPHARFVQMTDHICVMGLGMGYFLYLATINYAERITVYERDPAVIELFYMITEGISDWDDTLENLEIRQLDVLSDGWHDDEYYDHCYVDIWQSMNPESTIPDMQHIAARMLNCQDFSFWCQEMAFTEWAIAGAKDKGTTPDEMVWDSDLWDQFADDCNFPMALPFWNFDRDWYVRLAKKATERAYFD